MEDVEEAIADDTSANAGTSENEIPAVILKQCKAKLSYPNLTRNKTLLEVELAPCHVHVRCHHQSATYTGVNHNSITSGLGPSKITKSDFVSTKVGGGYNFLSCAHVFRGKDVGLSI